MCLAIPGKVVTITREQELAREGIVDFEGIRKSINLSLVPEASVDDYVLVHVGFAIGRIDAAEAKRVFETLRQMDELKEIGPTEPSPADR
jgi:hydrogenase expression/formation protein HypC